MIRLSQIFRPFNAPPPNRLPKLFRNPKETASKGYKLLCQYGFISQSSHGLYNILPLGQRVIEKLTKFLDNKMINAGAQKSYVPLMSKISLWEKAEMYDEAKDELYEVMNRKDQKLVLSPVGTNGVQVANGNFL